MKLLKRKVEQKKLKVFVSRDFESVMGRYTGSVIVVAGNKQAALIKINKELALRGLGMLSSAKSLVEVPMCEGFTAIISDGTDDLWI